VTGNMEERVAKIEQSLDVLIAIAIDRHLRDFPELGNARSPRMEHVLRDGGLNGPQIALLLGKSRQAVSQNLAR
jgi:hypothetical protein